MRGGGEGSAFPCFREFAGVGGRGDVGRGGERRHITSSHHHIITSLSCHFHPHVYRQRSKVRTHRCPSLNDGRIACVPVRFQCPVS